MRYLCVHCGHRFEHTGSADGAKTDGDDGDALRCPKCARTSGIEPAGGAGAGAGGGRPGWLLPSLVAAGLLLVAGGYAAWAAFSPDAVGDEVPFRPLSKNELRGHLRRLGVEEPTGAVRDLLQADGDVQRFAKDAVAGAGNDPVARTRAVVDAIRSRASAGGFVRWPRSEPRESPPILDAARTLERIEEDGVGFRAYPLEIAALAVSALRQVGVDAMVAEIAAFPNARTPVDPSGKLGYYGVAVYPSGEPGEGPAKVLDPFEGHGEPPDPGDVDVLDDVEAIAAALDHRAVHQAVREGDVAEAFSSIQAALKLHERSPILRSAHAAILLVSGGGQNAKGEFEAAAQLRSDAPRKNDLAGLYLAEGESDRAAREVGAALEARPDFAGGRATLAAVHLQRGEIDAARRELEQAEKLDPALHNLPLLWANYHLATHDPERAAAKALEAVELRPLEWQRRLQAARVLREAGRYDDMRRQARAALEQVPASQKESIRQLIEQTLGPTALEEPLDEAMAADDLAIPEIGDGLELGGDSMLLGEGGGGAGAGKKGPGLLGDDADLGGGSPLLKLGDPSTLKLREPGTELRLDGLTGSE